MKKSKRHPALWLIILGTLILLFIGLIMIIEQNLAQQTRAKRLELKSMILDNSAEEDERADGLAPAEKRSACPDYSRIATRYPDFKGWIYIPEYAIDGPIFVDSENPYKYERMSRDGSFSPLGEFGYLGDPLRSENLVVFGHSLSDGSGFAPIDRYPDAFDESDPTTEVILDLWPTRTRTRYLVVQSAYYPSGNNLFCTTDFASRSAYQHFLEQIRLPTEFEGQLLTLYTCKDHRSTWHTVLYCLPMTSEQPDSTHPAELQRPVSVQ